MVCKNCRSRRATYRARVFSKTIARPELRLAANARSVFGIGFAFSRSRSRDELTQKGGKRMSQLQASLIWLKDILEHLTNCRQQMEETDDPSTQLVLTESMLRDLESCRRVCEKLHQRTQVLQVA